jgi:hypothetical protein
LSIGVLNDLIPRDINKMNIKDLRNFMHALGKKIEQKTRQLKDAETEMHWNQTKLAKLKKELLKYEHNK